MKFVAAMCNGVMQIEDIELICTCLVQLFHANGNVIPLLKWAIKNEITATSTHPPKTKKKKILIRT